MSERIDVINGLRGWAIVGVVWHHLFYGVTGPGFRAFDLGGLKVSVFSPLANGWLGVNLFFVLSGFVLYLPYASRHRQMRSRGDAAGFYKHRARRLLPLYYLVVSLGMLITFPLAAGKPEPMDELLRNALVMATATFNFTHFLWMPKYNPVLWSLGVEIWFSLSFPLLLLLARRFGISRVFAAGLVGCLAVRLWTAPDPGFFGNPYLGVVKDGPFGRLDDFLLGMWLSQLYRARPDGLQRHAGRLLFLGVVSGFATCVLWDNVALGTIGRLWAAPLNNLLQVAMLGVIGGALGLSRALYARRVFDLYPVQLLGLMTYSIYLWHGLGTAFLRGDLEAERVVAYLALLLLISTITYRYIEFGHVADTRRVFGLRSVRAAV